jgi:SDR family mycofactocin-dependent oxidoreductase
VPGRLQGRVAFITGAARGQGRAHAVRFAQEGADIIGVDICSQMPNVGYSMATPSDLEQTAKLVEGLGRQMVTAGADVRDRESLDSALDVGMVELGRLDFVLANAGVMPIHGDLAESMQAWYDCLDVLLTGVLNTVESAYPRLVAQGEGGSIVLTGSMAGVQPMMRTQGAHSLGLLGYSAAKAGLVSLGRNYASILARHEIRVNIVHPTGVNTDMIHNEMIDTYHATADHEDLQVLINAIPVTAIEPEDVSNMMVWLCSDESRYFTGNALRVDAGASLR